MAAKRKSSQKVLAKQASNGNRNRKAGAKMRGNENRKATSAAEVENQLIEPAGPEDEAAARLAAQLARQPAALGMTATEIARDALAIAGHAFVARRALEAGKSPARAVAKARAVIEGYDAATVDNRDLAGMVLGIRFRSGTFTSGFRNIFYVA